MINAVPESPTAIPVKAILNPKLTNSDAALKLLVSSG
jgi:hypothetical protein